MTHGGILSEYFDDDLITSVAPCSRKGNKPERHWSKASNMTHKKTQTRKFLTNGHNNRKEETMLTWTQARGEDWRYPREPQGSKHNKIMRRQQYRTAVGERRNIISHFYGVLVIRQLQRPQQSALLQFEVFLTQLPRLPSGLKKTVCGKARTQNTVVQSVAQESAVPES